MSWRAAKSLIVLRDQVNKAAPNRSKASDGLLGDDSHAASASDHNPNRNGVVCALDLTHDPANGFDAHALAEHLRVNRHPNLRYVISNARIAGYWNNWQWGASSGHYQHCHISVGTHWVGDGQTYDNYDSTQAWSINISKEEEMAKPTYKEVLNHFRTFIGTDPTEEQMNYYVARDWGVLNGDILQWNFQRRKEITKELEDLKKSNGKINKESVVKYVADNLK